MASNAKPENRYNALIEAIFFRHWKKGLTEFAFSRDEFSSLARQLEIVLPKNIGDAVYSFRFRTRLPAKILETQRSGMEWTIRGAGKGQYRFRLAAVNRIIPNQNLMAIPIPDATPELIRCYALGDEQALLAIVRYNRLIDTFLGLTTYSLQNHLRTTVKGIGQIEIDELYIGLDKHGCHFVIPVQAKTGKDQIGAVQISQDLAFSEQKFSQMRCRPVAAQFMSGKVIALFELVLDGDLVKIAEERHYKLVPAEQIDRAAVSSYKD